MLNGVVLCPRFKPTWEKFTENFPKGKNSKR